MTARTIEWRGDEGGSLRLLDQAQLPGGISFIDCRTPEDVVAAIRALQVRGAPAIGVAAAYGVVLGLQPHRNSPASEFAAALDQVTSALARSRPTAVNLFWALDRMRRAGRQDICEGDQRLEALLREARQIEAEDREMCAAIGRHGAPLLEGLQGVLTHCNAGALATAGEGTALAVIFEAARRNPALVVYADETRPLLQGARLTAWELVQRNISCTVICDNMAGQVMRAGRVQAVVVGADRIAGNGDVANKIGTYSVALLARAHGLPFYVAAPSSTFDLALQDGGQIPIEERSADEIAVPWGRRSVPAGADIYNPAFDVTPAGLTTAIITERGVISPVSAATVGHLLQAATPSPPAPAALR